MASKPNDAVVPQVEVAAIEVPTEVKSVDQVVEEWVLSYLYNSPVSRSTEVWNHITQTLPDLKAALKEAFTNGH